MKLIMLILLSVACMGAIMLINDKINNEKYNE